MSAVKLYQNISDQLTNADIDIITDYYHDWKGQHEVDLKFRFIRIVARTRDSSKLKWYHLHQLVNKRRILNHKLPLLLNEIIANDIIPLRIFHSCAEWLAPNEVCTGRNTRIINSGFLPFENDTNLAESIETAKQLTKILNDPLIVYSGNKSIHVWEKFQFKIQNNKELAYSDAREQKERLEREKRFNEIQATISYKLDRRISTDPRRVVPVIDSINGFTKRKVKSLTPEILNDQDLSEKLTTGQ